MVIQCSVIKGKRSPAWSTPVPTADKREGSIRSPAIFHTDHFSNPEIITSSPPKSLFFMISGSFSAISPASPFMKPQSSAIFWAISALVRVLGS